MIVNFWLTVAVVGGGIAGLGLFLLAVQFVPAGPALGPALKRLHPAAAQPEAIITPVDKPTHNADLDILGRSRDQHITGLILSGLAGLMLPVVATTVAFVLGLRLPIVLPLGVTLVFAGGLVYLAHQDLATRANSARAEFVRALCTYTALTAHQVRSGHGAVEAMERAAGICDGWPYVRLRTALLTAQLQMRPPWDEIKALAVDIEVPELASFADIMRSAGTDGAQVYQTLRAQSTSLRDQVRVRALETAKVRTSKLDIPSTTLIIILLVLIGYPLMMSLFDRST